MTVVVIAKCQNLIRNLIFFTVILGFKRKTYSTSEGNGSVEVCVQVKSGVLRSSLNLSLATVDGSATGEQYPDYLGSIHSGIRFDCLLFTLECTVHFFFYNSLS